MLATAMGSAIVLSSAAVAQGIPAPAPMPELRADVITGHQPAVQLGGGVQLPMGRYVRLGVVGAAGVPTGDGAKRGLDARLDLLARFLLDPFRQRPLGLSAGGGLSLRAEPGDRLRPLLLIAMELEGRRSARGWAPALQLGLGGGARIGVVLRRAAKLAR